MRAHAPAQAKAARHIDHLIASGLFADLHCHCIQRPRQSLARRHRAAISAVIIFRRPAIYVQRCIVKNLIGIEPAFQRGQIDHRLKGRARLATRLHGAVELAFAISAPADHSANGAIGGHHHHGRLRRLAGVASRRQYPINGALCRQLHGAVEGRHDI